MTIQRLVGHALPSLGHRSRWLRHPDPERHPSRRGHHGERSSRDQAPHAAPCFVRVESLRRIHRCVLDGRRLPQTGPEASIAAALQDQAAHTAHDQRVPVHGWARRSGNHGGNAIDGAVPPRHAARSPRARMATRRTRRADQCAELHQPLIQSRWGRCPLDQVLRRRPQPVLGGACRRIERAPMDPKQHARHVAVDDRRAFTVDDAGDRARGVPAHPGQRRELGGPLGDPAAESGHARLGRLVQSTRAPVVPQSLPHREHLVLAGRCKFRHGGPPRHEGLEPLDDSTDLRLLKHALADEGAITAPLAPPRQVARVLTEPSLDGGDEPLWRG